MLQSVLESSLAYLGYSRVVSFPFKDHLDNRFIVSDCIFSGVASYKVNFL